MNGIEKDKLNEIIKKIDNILSSIRSYSGKMNNSLREMNDCYDGKALNSILSNFCNQTVVYDNLLNLYQSYLDYLKNVRDCYILQDRTFSEQIGKLTDKMLGE